RFELVDAKGLPSASLETGFNGEGTLAFYDEKGKTRIQLGLAADHEPHLIISDARERTRMHLSLNKLGGEPLLSLTTGPGIDNTISLSSGDLGAHLHMDHVKGGRLSLGLSGGGPRITVEGPDGKQQVAIEAMEFGPMISLREKNGRTRARWYVTPEG